MNRESVIKETAERLGLSKSVVEDDFFFLDAIRESGITNMFGASPYLQQYDEKLTDIQAKQILVAWMDSFND